MAEFLQATQGVLTILTILGVGYSFHRFGWMREEESELLTRFVVAVTLPPYMVVNLTGNFTRESLFSLARVLPVPFLAMFLGYLLATLLGHFLHLPRRRRGVFLVAFSFSNTIFVGLPVAQVLFGEEATPLALLYYMVNTTLFWTLGAWNIVASGDTGTEKKRITGREMARRLVNPPFVAFFLGMGLLLLGVPLPGLLLRVSSILGNATTPLSLFCVGTTIDFRKLRLTGDLGVVLLGRFVVSPLLTLLVARFFFLPEPARSIFSVMASMPVMMQSSILARVYRADYEYATGLITASTALSALLIPLIRMAVPYL